MQFVLDKVTMPEDSPPVTRGRLLDLLEKSAASCTSTIISGRAGTGKTMLAADYARRCRRSVAWFKVDASDADLGDFSLYLTESVRRSRGDSGREALPRWQSGASPTEVADAFVYDLAEGGGAPTLVVIEDLHLVYDADWLVPFFQRVLPLVPEEVHVLVTGRGLPPAPLWRMRSKQLLYVVEEDDLAFTPEEAAELFLSYGVTEARAIQAALRQTYGRAALLDAAARRLAAAPVGSAV